MTHTFLWVAFALLFGGFDRKGDFSYGTYIYAFPVQQGMALLGIPRKGVRSLFYFLIASDLGFAFLTYR